MLYVKYQSIGHSKKQLFYVLTLFYVKYLCNLSTLSREDF